METENKRYSIVWKQYHPESDIAYRFYVAGKEGYLPFFIEGDKLERLENKQNIQLNEYMLLRGILFSYDDETMPFFTDFNRKTLQDLLPILAEGFGCKSVEQLILDVSLNLKRSHNTYAGYKVLKNGLLIEPKSSFIRSNLIKSIWEMWKEEPDCGYDYMDEVIENFHLINLDAILPKATEMTVYTAFVSMYFKYPGKISDFLKKQEHHMHHEIIKNKIKYLLENRDSTLEDVFLNK